MKSQDEALQILHRYLQLRLHNADWKEYSKLITWPDEPSWDCNWVVSKYDFGTPRKVKGSVVAPVASSRLGLFCYDFEFKPDPTVVTINYILVRRPTGWKVNAPLPDYPDIGADVLLKTLRALAEDSRESPERRARFSATARKVAEADRRRTD